jgi:hypothetical protein
MITTERWTELQSAERRGSRIREAGEDKGWKLTTVEKFLLFFLVPQWKMSKMLPPRGNKEYWCEKIRCG